MIAKRIPSPKATSSASRLVRYVVNAQGGLDPRSWTRTADYILDNAATNAQGEKVGGVRITNCGTDDPAAATIAIEAIQAANTRSKSDKTYHLVFSFPPGEQPPLEVLHAIEDELVAAIGYTDHQRISAVHVDTDHLHVHVAINKVHPTGLQNIEPYYDKQRLMEACERLEITHGLQRTNHGLEQINERRNRIRLDPEQHPDDRDSRFRAYLRQSYNLTLADPPKAETLNGLRNLSGCGVARTAEGTAVLLPGDARDGVEQRGKALPDGVRRQGNGDRADAGQRELTGRAADIEAHAGVETLAGYVARDVAPAMRAATTWAAVHEALAEHGLELRPRGAGLVIGEPSLGLWARASDCGRDLSMKSLTERLGAFQPRQGTAEQGGRRAAYKVRPRQTHPSTAHLFAQYQRERQARLAARKAGLLQIRQETAAKRDEMRRWQATQRIIGKLGKGPSRRAVAATGRVRAAAMRAQLQKTAAERRKQLMAQTAMPVWNDWLAQRAAAGDADALAVLRSREERDLRLRGDLLTADKADKARTVILGALKPVARKDGAVTYRTVDGGMVVDRARFVQAQTATTGAAFVALTLAAQRFEGQALDVQGSDTFKAEVAKLAAVHRLNVRFADPVMEAARQAAIATLPAKPEPTVAQPADQGKAGQSKKAETHTGKSVETVSEAVTKWIDDRNRTRDRISSIGYTRLWSPGDSGAVIYHGRRKMDDGSEVLLLKRGDEMLVKPSTARVVAKASKWKVGRTVQIDGRGRFIESTKARGREL